MPEIFNPFEDRLCRDIRNDLSESILEVISSHSIEPARQAADRYLVQELEPVYTTYIHSRLERYASALTQLEPDSQNGLVLAARLWDLRLFFEVHEVLEPEWMTATGDTKLLLQGLIRAAGVYINLELGYHARAAKISSKTTPVLRQFQDVLDRDLRADTLISALETLAPTPPLLVKHD